MYFTNEIKITLKSKKAAINALEILRTRLVAGFDCDKTYKKNPSEQMAQAFFVKGKSIVLPEEFGCLAPEDAESVQFELLQNLAENLNEDFSCKIYNYSDCSEAEITAKYQDGTLSIKSTYYPNGYCEYLCCEECGEDVVRISRYKEGKIYICPECGEEIDLSEAYEENKPEIVEKIIKIK